MVQVDAHNPQFKTAVSVVNHTNKHLFLTGKAGTGKTTFLKYIKEHTFKKMAVVAPTGVAAINAGGVTIHSFFQLPFGTFISNNSEGWNQTPTRFFNTHQLLGNLRMHKKKQDLIRELELIIIDEVSMLRADILDAIDMVLRSVRRRHHEPFGGVQMVYIGDMYQLPPVVKEADWTLLREQYQAPFFFDARVLQEVPPIYLELKKIYRQEDQVFIQLLNHIRNNCCSSDDLNLLEGYYDPSFVPKDEDGFITLTTHNYLADKINQKKLAELPGKLYQLEAEIKGDFQQSAFPTEKTLLLKEGAQIMFVKNDKGEDRKYFNGKTGTISKIIEEKIYIKFPKEQDLLVLTQENWRNIRYQYDETKDKIVEKELGVFKQFPIRLAWAITIHKSQGLTFDKAVIDAGRAFAAGQVYVALSRLTGLEGIVLRSKITPQSIKTNEQVLAFSNQELSTEELEQELKQARKKFLYNSILAAFQWNRLLIQLEHLQNKKSGTALKLAEAAWLNKINGILQKQQTIGGKFGKVLERLIGSEDYAHLNERSCDAADWFQKGLNEVVEEVEFQIQRLKVKSRTKKKVRQLMRFLQVVKSRKNQLEQVKLVTKTLINSDDDSTIQKLVTQLSEQREQGVVEEKTVKKPLKGESKRISLTLFREDHTPPEIAEMRGLKKNTVVNHLISYISTGEVKIEELFSTKKIQSLFAVIKEFPEAPSTEIRMKTKHKYSYSEIKAVQSHLRYLERQSMREEKLNNDNVSVK